MCEISEMKESETTVKGAIHYADMSSDRSQGNSADMSQGGLKTGPPDMSQGKT